MKQSDVVIWVHDEVKSVLNSTNLVNLGTPDDHVDLADDREDHPYPFVGIQKVTGIPQSAGIGSGNLSVDALNYDNNNVLQSIDYGRDTVLRLNIIPLTDGDAQLREDLGDELADHFELLLRQDNLHADMEDIDVGEATPQDRTDDFVRADGIPLEIEYTRFITDDDPATAKTVKVDVDVADEVSDLIIQWGDDSWGDYGWPPADAFDETFS